MANRLTANRLTANRKGSEAGEEAHFLECWCIRENFRRQAQLLPRGARMQTSERDRLLGVMLRQLEKQFGTSAVIQLGENTVLDVGVISTGAISLDAALGVGGLPRGRVTEIFGPESSGKTTLALHAIAQAQAAGGVAAFIDVEHALDPQYAQALGVDIKRLIVSQPDCGEQALEIANSLVASNVVDIVVVDSVAALVPKAEMEGEM